MLHQIHEKNSINQCKISKNSLEIKDALICAIISEGNLVVITPETR